MIVEAAPIRWQVCFDPQAESWLTRLIPGRFKHVRAFGFVPVQEVWIFFDVTRKGTVLRAARANSAAADRLIEAWIRDCEVLTMAPQGRARLPVFALCCTSAVRHLIGLRTGALRPDALWQDCRDHGAVPLDEAAPGRPAASAA